jgi:Holliday junction resolvase RusA-like endonuclease
MCALGMQVKFVSWSSATTCQPLRCVISWNGKRKAVDPDLLRPLTEIAPILTSKKPVSPVKASKSSNPASATAHATACKTYTTLSSPSASPCASPLKVCNRPQESIEVSASPISLDPRRGAVPCPQRKPRHEAGVECKFGPPSLCAAIRGGSCEASSSSGWVSASDGVGVTVGRKKETRAVVPEIASTDVSSASSWETALAHLRFPDDVAEGAEDAGADATASGHQESKVDGESLHVEPQDARRSDGGIAPAHSDPAQDALAQDEPAQDEPDDVRQQLKTRLLKTLHRRRDKEHRRVAKGRRGIWSSAIDGGHDMPGNVTSNSVTADECPQRSKKGSGGGKGARVTGSIRSKVVSAPIAERGAEDEQKGRRSAAKSKSRKNRGDAGAAASQVCEVAGPPVGWYPRSEGNGGACAGDLLASSPQVASANAAIAMPADINTSVAANASVSASVSRAVAAADHDRLEALFNRHREHGRRNVCTLVVDGDPVALKRPRHRFGGHTYDPNYRDKKRFVKECQQQLPSEPLQGAIALSMLFELPRAKFHFSTAKKTLGQRKESAPELPIKVPDLDNLVKFVLDALNEHLFVDDKQICEINARKCYRDIAGAGRTVIHVCHL